MLMLIFAVECMGQNIFLPLGSPAYDIIDRQFILTGSSDVIFPSVKPFRRGDVSDIAYHLLQAGQTNDQADLRRILLDNNEFVPTITEKDRRQYLDSSRTFYVKTDTVLEQGGGDYSKNPFLKVFYKSPAHFFEFDTEDFYIRVNPLLHFMYGQESEDSDPLFVNKRGIELRGGIDNKVFFATNIIETQIRPPSYVNRRIAETGAVPDAGLFKVYRSSFFDFDNGYDYLNSNGYIGLNISKHVGLQLGHGKNMIGDGYRSLFLSDFSKNYFFLKLNTRIWKFHYQNIFAELSAEARNTNREPFTKKYMAAHYLSIKPLPNLSIGVFEAVIQARENQFELQYLNPVIFYRTIEHHVGSPDNVLIGMNARWDFLNQFSLYGQLVFDEFRLEQLLSSDKWWGNKYGFQLGLKYINAFHVNALDIQVEYNKVRPYTYSHFDSIGSYSHFNQPLAHPLGANFGEFIGITTYRPTDRLMLQGKLFVIRTAEDTDEIYYGTNILRSNDTRSGEFGIEQGQGIGVDNVIVVFKARYMLKHHFYIEAEYFRRNYDARIDQSDLLTSYVSLGLRWNLFDRNSEF